MSEILGAGSGNNEGGQFDDIVWTDKDRMAVDLALGSANMITRGAAEAAKALQKRIGELAETGESPKIQKLLEDMIVFFTNSSKAAEAIENAALFSRTTGSIAQSPWPPASPDRSRRKKK